MESSKANQYKQSIECELNLNFRIRKIRCLSTAQQSRMAPTTVG